MKFFWVLCFLVSVAYARKNSKQHEAEIREMLSNGESDGDLDKVKNGLKKLNRKMQKSLRRTQNENARQLIKQQNKEATENDPRPEESIAMINEREGLSEYLYQGDVRLTSKQIELLSLDETSRAKRMAEFGWEFGKWDISKPIQYKLEGDFDAVAREAIRSATEILNQKTCLRFEENNYNYDIQFIREDGCWSNIGKRESAYQNISIGHGCEQTSTVIHELCHALGYVHEQSRIDRDDHIIINPARIGPEGEGQFDKLSYVSGYSQEYDFGSIMHYGAYDFGINADQPVMLAINPLYQKTMGTESAQLLDFLMINDYYGCTARCPHRQCEHGGVAHPNNCNTCLCPDAWTGDRCQHRGPGNAPQVATGKCGASLTPTDEWQSVDVEVGVKDYNTIPGVYECFWTIQPIHPEEWLEIQVTDVNMDYSSKSCVLEGGQIYIDDNSASNPISFCSTSDIVGTTINSTGTAVIRGFSRQNRAMFTFQYRIAP